MVAVPKRDRPNSEPRPGLDASLSRPVRKRWNTRRHRPEGPDIEHPSSHAPRRFTLRIHRSPVTRRALHHRGACCELASALFGPRFRESRARAWLSSGGRSPASLRATDAEEQRVADMPPRHGDFTCMNLWCMCVRVRICDCFVRPARVPHHRSRTLVGTPLALFIGDWRLLTDESGHWRTHPTGSTSAHRPCSGVAASTRTR